MTDAFDYQPTIGELKTLIGNPDVYAVQDKKGGWAPVRERLTPGVLRKHRAGDITVGTYIVQPPDQARTLVFDIDDPSDVAQLAHLAAVANVLDSIGLRYLVENSGRKGFHLWVVADEYMGADTLYRLGRGVREEAGLPKLEVFPKQTTVRDLGNLVKLPGGVHRVTGNPNPIRGEWVEPNAVDELEAVALKYPELYTRDASTPASIEYPCVHAVQVGFEEGGRNIHLFHLATMLRKFSLTDENVAAVVHRANEQCDPPLETAEVEGLLESSKFSGPICDQLSDEVGCGDQCIKSRHPGLFTRKGALKWAADGEEVVVRVLEHTDDGRTVELEHPDVVQARAMLHDAKPPKRRTE
jgi:hypothetical protein